MTVVEGVDGAFEAGGGKRCKRARGRSRAFELGVRRQASGFVEREHLVQRRSTGPAGRQGVVVHPEHPVWVQVDIKLTAVGPKVGRALEGGQGILGALAGGAAVGNYLGAGHADSLTSIRPRRLTFRRCQ